MTIERSHGKARPTLPRASDLTAPDSATTRTRHQGPDGRWVTGNKAALGAGSTAPIRRMLGDADTTDAEARTVARDAARIFADALREMPSDGAQVRQLLALQARHLALAGFWSSRASLAGLGSPEGIEAQEHASRNGQRAERLTVSALDVARVMAGKRPDGPIDLAEALRNAK